MNIICCDILVVGGGGGGLRAAIAAKENNKKLNVLLATKNKLGTSGVTAIACSDRMAFHATLDHTEPRGEDSWRYHAADIYEIGGRVSDYDLAGILACKSKEAFAYLDDLGVPFVKLNGLPDQFLTDGSEYARACYTGPKTAVEIEKALVKRCLELEIGVLNSSMVARLVKNKDGVVGAIVIDMKESDTTKAVSGISTGAVILATGGAGTVYKNNVFPAGMSGDGYALAYDLGAELVNMEFIQMGIASTRAKFSCSGSMMRAVPRLINDKGEEFLPKYFPANTPYREIYNVLFQKGFSWPVSYEHKTSLLDIAVYKEQRAGRKIYLDFGKNPEGFSFDLLTEQNRAHYIKEVSRELGDKRHEAPIYRLLEINQPSITWWLEHGVDLLKGDMVEVACCAQHFQGGVKIDKFARSTVHGLWAVGETAGGQHGANRPGGNALLDCQVFGKIAAESAARYVEEIKPVLRQGGDEVLLAQVQALAADLKSAHSGDISAYELRRRVQAIMEQEGNVVRTEEGLKDALKKLSELESAKPFIGGHGPAYYLEDLMMLTVCKILLTAALARDESRGPHLRFAKYADNFPLARKDQVWDKYIVVHKLDGQLELATREPVATCASA